MSDSSRWSLSYGHNSWPLDILRSAIYSEKECIEMLLVYVVWESRTSTSFEESVMLDQETIKKQSAKINSYYSYMKRLNTSMEAEKIYLAKKNKHKKKIDSISNNKKNVTANIKTCVDIVNKHSKLYSYLYQCIEEYSECVPTFSLKKDFWINYEKSRIKNEIDGDKLWLSVLKEELSKKIAKYYKLKRGVTK